MKTILEAASDSGSFGFSDAWPLCISQWPLRRKCLLNVPSCPHSVNVHSLCHVYNELHVGVVVVICATGYLLITRSD